MLITHCRALHDIQNFSHACTIQLDDKVVVTGGYDIETKVSVYSISSRFSQSCLNVEAQIQVHLKIQHKYVQTKKMKPHDHDHDQTDLHVFILQCPICYIHNIKFVTVREAFKKQAYMAYKSRLNIKLKFIE